MVAAVRSIEDSLCEEDIARQTCPNHWLENAPAFLPPASVIKGKDSCGTEKDHDQNDGAQSSQSDSHC